MKDVQIRRTGCGEVLEAEGFVEGGSGIEVTGQDRMGWSRGWPGTHAGGVLSGLGSWKATGQEQNHLDGARRQGGLACWV